MNVIFVMFDSLIRKGIGAYGGNISTPNIDKFSKKAVTFDTHYACSMPCMPARRDFLTGRPNFLHASWGCLEPFDRPLTKELRKSKGVYSHLITDHPHYFTYGGSGYHSSFDSWEFMRGQEGDPCTGIVDFDYKQYDDFYNPTYYPVGDEKLDLPFLREQHIKNREKSMTAEKDMSLVKCYEAAFTFLDRNHNADNWFLQLECFDPHEPYYAAERFREMYDVNDGLVTDWPFYRRVFESKENAEKLIKNYSALLTMCDEYFGRLLQYMDQYRLWENTMLIFTTDHGILLSEHDWWGKNRQPYYEEISHLPLMIYHPDYADKGGERRTSLTHATDFAPTIFDAFGDSKPKEATGQSLLPLLSSDNKDDRGVIFGIFGGAIGATDGRYAYYLYPEDLSSSNNLYEYTLMPEHLRNQMSIAELTDMELAPPFDFTQGVKTLKIKARDDSKRIPLDREGFLGSFQDTKTVLFDLVSDPGQNNPISDPAIEKRMKQIIINEMKKADAAPETYKRFRIG
ncbi:sulfatase [Sediminispirochaeta smaragdinae DSM 11293]|uniref:Sulfatase n=1 Tax=Sediminispirochaeta smaragdinae (strain DSM 11293 / JCM 15392 / SEBR 4228) TaxID=573413 RepID=E1RBQ5_SEDSS|nr:sulfatase [Sediminispirochaeta smaragdinae DSM 11293]